GLIGYIVLPTAPPRMFPSIGFIDHHSNGVVQLAANPYAAMPSLHAADALIVGLVLSALVRRRLWKVVWLVWPFWVCFAVMATGITSGSTSSPGSRSARSRCSSS